MKILYVGSLEPIACSTFYLKALRDLGHQVYTYDPKAFQTHSLLERISVRIQKAPTSQKLLQIREELLTLFRENVFDIVLVIAENFLPDIFDEVRQLRGKAPTFIYHSHDNNFSTGILKPKNFFETLPKYDLLFTTKSQNVAKYKALGNLQSYFVPSAYEPTFHRPVPDSKSRYKDGITVSFVGTYDYSRDKFLDVLNWNDLHIWGNEWKRYAGFKQHQNHITPKAIYLEDYADVVSHSKLSLGLLREEAEDLHTQRTFEIPACGSLQIAPRNEEILSFFDEDKEIVCFSSPEELKDKVQYYQTHDKERQNVAKQGYQRCLKSGHKYLDRVKTMIERATTFVNCR